MPTPTPPYQFIAIARTIARGFTEQAAGHPEGDALTEAAQAIWRGIEVLEGMDRRAWRRSPAAVCYSQVIRMGLKADRWGGFGQRGGGVMERLLAILFWLFAALVVVVMLALYLGWWPFGISSTF